jgi:glutathione S-transferase
MATHTLSILKPSVNNLSARILIRAAGLECDEVDMWGSKGTPEFLSKDPADLTPLLEESGLPNGSLWESCAIMQYICNRDGLEDFYPSDPGQRAMVDSAMFYVVGTLYPLIGRATYPALGFPNYPGEVAASDADAEVKAQAQRDATDALAQPLAAIGSFFFNGRRFIGGDRPSIADIRLAASLEFLAAIDYELPAWASQFMNAIETTLGDAYSEPAGDVRGFIASVKAPVS